MINLKNLKNWKNENLKNILLVALVAIVIILGLRLEYCRPVKYIEKHTLDSIITKSSVDTMYIKVPIKNTIKPVKPEIIYTYVDTCLDLHVNKYVQAISDTFMDGKITAITTGTLDSLKLDYVAKIPTIIKKDSVIYYKTNTVYKRPLCLMVGVDLGGNLSQVIIEPTIGIATNKGYTYSVGYDVYQKTVNVGFRKLIPLQK